MLKTAESVSPSHPDKLCDRISDAILDACLKDDKNSRVAVETMGGHKQITITGELTSNSPISEKEIEKIAERITGKDYQVRVNIVKQSNEIASGVDTGGAGDQGIMVGFASSENNAMLPNEFYLARSICQYIYARHQQDGKTQVTLDGSKIKTVVASFCQVSGVEIRELIKKWWQEFINDNYAEPSFEIFANPAGDWSQGGFEADTGLTGRKLAVDNYGPQIPIGGGAFSGKDATKVDRSGAYMARRIAVDLLRENKYREVIVKLAYAIGRKDPVMASFEATLAELDEENNPQIINGEIDKNKYDLTPQGIINFLDLKSPCFEKTAEWGAFGHALAWDK